MESLSSADLAKKYYNFKKGGQQTNQWRYWAGVAVEEDGRSIREVARIIMTGSKFDTASKQYRNQFEGTRKAVSKAKDAYVDGKLDCLKGMTTLKKNPKLAKFAKSKSLKARTGKPLSYPGQIELEN